MRDTTAWSISRIFEFAAAEDENGSIINSTNLVTIVQALGQALADPKQKIYTRERICNAMGRLADIFQSHPGNTSPLSPFFRSIVEVRARLMMCSLLAVISRCGYMLARACADA